MWLRRSLSRLGRVSGFALVPMLSIVSPLLAIPAVTLAFGAPGWSAVAIGQSVGAASAVVVELGWGLTGTQRVARQSRPAARRLLALSMSTKLVVLIPLLIFSAITAYLLSNQHKETALLTAVGTALAGLSSVWYYIGRGQLNRIFLLDAIPRLLAIVLASTFIIAGGPLWIYPVIGLILPQTISLIMVWRIEQLKFKLLTGLGARRTWRLLRLQGNALAARSLSAMYIALPVAIVSIVSPQSVPLFAAIERLQRMTLQVLAAVPNMMQKWVGQVPTAPARYARVKKSLIYNFFFAFGASTVYVALAPLAMDIIFSDIVQLPLELSLLSGLLVFVVCISRSTGNIALVAFKKIETIKWSALFGAVLGLASLVILASGFGTKGALIAEVMAEMLVLAIQCLGILKFRRSLGAKESPSLKGAEHDCHQTTNSIERTR